MVKSRHESKGKVFCAKVSKRSVHAKSKARTAKQGKNNAFLLFMKHHCALLSIYAKEFRKKMIKDDWYSKSSCNRLHFIYYAYQYGSNSIC